MTGEEMEETQKPNPFIENEEQYGIIRLLDYGAPSYITFSKSYFGTLSDIEAFIQAIEQSAPSQDELAIIHAYEEFCSGNREVTIKTSFMNGQFFIPLQILHTARFSAAPYRWIHNNIWDCPNEMLCDRIETKHFWAYDGNLYWRFVKAQFKNLQMRDSSVPASCPVKDNFWGHPQTLVYDAPYTWTRLGERENCFKTLPHMEADYTNFSKNPTIDLTEVMNDVFGDG